MATTSASAPTATPHAAVTRHEARRCRAIAEKKLSRSSAERAFHLSAARAWSAAVTALHASARRSLLVRRLRRRLRRGRDPLGHLVDRALQLRVDPPGELGRIVGDFDVRIDAVAFGKPLPLRIEHAEGGHRDAAAVDERRRAADADEAAPRARAD